MYDERFGEPINVSRFFVVIIIFFSLLFVLLSLLDDINYIFLHLEYLVDDSNYRIEECVVEDFIGSTNKYVLRNAMVTVSGDVVRCASFLGDKIGDSILLLVRNDGKVTRYEFGININDITCLSLIFIILVMSAIYKKKGKYRKRLIRSPRIINANITDIKKFEYGHIPSTILGAQKTVSEYEISCSNNDKIYISDKFNNNIFAVGDDIKVMIDEKNDMNYCVLYSDKLERAAEEFMNRNIIVKFIDYVYDLIM